MTDEREGADGPEADLTDDQLAAANEGAEVEVDAEAADDEVLNPDDEADEVLAQEALAQEVAADRAQPNRPGARERAAEASRQRAAAATRGPRAPKATRTAFPIDPSLRIKDPASAAFVIVSIVVFALIFLNAMAFGRGGAFNPIPTPTPFVSPSPGPSVSPGPSGSAAPSGSPAATPAASPAASPAATVALPTVPPVSTGPN